MTYMLLPVITHSAGFMRRAPRLFSFFLPPYNSMAGGPPSPNSWGRASSFDWRKVESDRLSICCPRGGGPPGARRYPLISKSC